MIQVNAPVLMTQVRHQLFHSGTYWREPVRVGIADDRRLNGKSNGEAPGNGIVTESTESFVSVVHFPNYATVPRRGAWTVITVEWTVHIEHGMTKVWTKPETRSNTIPRERGVMSCPPQSMEKRRLRGRDRTQRPKRYTEDRGCKRQE